MKKSAIEEILSQTGDITKRYVDTRLHLFQLQAAGQLAKATGIFSALLLAILLFFVAIIFMGMALGFWIEVYTGSFALGFACSAGIFVLLLVILIIFRKRLLQRPMLHFMIKRVFKK